VHSLVIYLESSLPITHILSSSKVPARAEKRPPSMTSFDILEMNLMMKLLIVSKRILRVLIPFFMQLATIKEGERDNYIGRDFQQECQQICDLQTFFLHLSFDTMLRNQCRSRLGLIPLI